ncbi:MAG: NAD(P)/FAD-dependent oxidoreductase, partial [Blastochloris sp.]|nr:NAD(P)/FAD-dependent oxidoreductase [Blastochloris sp.]
MFRILNPITMICRYSQWLHLRWPSGRVEKLPVMEPDGTTSVEGVRIVGDLTGIPLLKFSADSGARAVQALCLEPRFQQSLKLKKNPELFDLAIIGGGISGVAAAMEAQKNGLHFRIFEANQLFSTVSNFPKAKPIYTYPTEMVPAGDLQFHATTKETLLEEMEAQWLQAGIETTVARIERVERKDGELLLHHADKGITRARRVIIAIGRSGNFRKLNVPGETLDKVSNRLHDPADFVGKNVLVVGAGDSALEAAISLCDSGAKVMLSARSKELSRPKPENRAKLLELAQGSTNDLSGSLTLALGSQVKEILPHEVTLVLNDGTQKMIANDAVFTMLGREAPLDFFRRSGIRIQGEWKATNVAAMLLFITFCFWLYHWKG